MKEEVPLCDFCNKPYPEWYYRTKAFTMELWLEDMSDHKTIHDQPDYAACDVCADLIDQGDRHGLALRCATTFLEKHPESPMDMEYTFGAILDIHESGFWKYKTSGRVRTGDAK